MSDVQDDVLKEQAALSELAQIPGSNPAAAKPKPAAAKPKPAAAKPKPAAAKPKPAEPEPEPEVPAPEGVGLQAIARSLRKGPKIQLMIHETPDSHSGPVFLAINGYAYNITPGVWVTVPKAVVKVLEQAVEQRPLMKDGFITGYRNAPRYPYSTKPVDSE